jgi:FRG domain-containing protein
MEILGQQPIWSFYRDGDKAELVNGSNNRIREGPGHTVTNYLDLATKIAELQFRNWGHVLLFRGQPRDHKDDQGRTKLRPSIFRADHPPGQQMLTERFERLALAGQRLVERYVLNPALNDRVENDRLKRQRILRWSILQHYKICDTPLLDVTQSIRIAASFASHRANVEAFVFVLGVPNLSGAVTVSAEAGIQIIRLASVCPPCAVRPHLQEGYLLGEYPEIDAYEQKAQYVLKEIDFGRRLIAKFRFNPATFWESVKFPLVMEEDLYPSPDPLLSVAEDVRVLLQS